MDNLNYQESDCLAVSVREDGRDGDGNFKLVFKLEHQGHQSYGQRFTVDFAEGFSVVETPGDVTAEVSGNQLTLQRNNQLNDNGMTEIWMKVAAASQPQINGFHDIFCCREEGVSGDIVKSGTGSVLQVIRQRRSVRGYLPDAVPEDKIEQIVEAGTYAATGMNRQSPIILAVTNRELRDKLSAMNAKIMGKEEGFDPFYGAPVILVVLADKDIPTYLYDGSLVMGNMMMAAEELGLGSCWIHRAKEEFEMEEGKEILASLDIEGNYEGIGHLALGYAAEEKKPAAPRKEDYVYFLG